MNPFFISAVVSSAVARSLARQCKRCGHQQVVAASKSRHSVACDVCGAALLPHPADRQDSEDDGDR